MAKRVCRNCREVVECTEMINLNHPLLYFLYALLIVPGFIYRITRIHYRICPKCQGSMLVPLNSKVGKKILRSENVQHVEGEKKHG